MQSEVTAPGRVRSFITGLTSQVTIGWPEVLRAAVALATLGLSAYLAQATYGTISLADLFHVQVLLGLVGITVVALFMLKPQAGPVGMIMACTVIPFSLGTGSQSDLNAAILLAGLLVVLWLLSMFVVRKHVTLAPSPVNKPLLMMTLVVLLAFGVGQLPWFGVAEGAPMRAQLGQLAIFVLSAATLLLVGNQIREVVWLRRMTWMFVALGGLFVFSWAVPGMGQISSLFQPGMSGSMFWTWIVAVALSQALLNDELSRLKRGALLAIVGMAFYIGLVKDPGWTSGWMPPAIAAGVIVWFGKPKLRPLLVVAALVMAFRYMTQLNDLVLGGDNEYSLMTRQAAWQIIIELVKVNPLFGLGPANYYWYTPLIPILGYAVVFNSHNNYVDIVAQTGLLGMACFLWFGVAAGLFVWRLSRRTSHGFNRAYAFGAMGGLVATLAAGMLGDWVLPFVYNIGFTGFRASILAWLFLGGLIVIDRATGADKVGTQVKG